MILIKFNGTKIILQVKRDGSYLIKKKSAKSITPIDLLVGNDYSNAIELLEEQIATKKFRPGFYYFNYNHHSNKLVPSDVVFSYKVYAPSEPEFVDMLKSGKIKPKLDKGYYLWYKHENESYEYNKVNNYDFPNNYTEILGTIIDAVDLSIIEFFNAISNNKYSNYVAVCDMIFKHLLIKNKEIYQPEFQFKFSPDHQTKLDLLVDVDLINIFSENENSFDYYVMIMKEFKNVKYSLGLEDYQIKKLEKIKHCIETKINCKLFEL